MVDSSQISPYSVPGGQINKTLQEQVGAGHGDELTPGSAVYLIKRDPARSIRRGRQLFQRKFTLRQGLGPRVSPDSSGDIFANRQFGAGIMDSCAGCHGRPRGSAGHGGDVVTRPDSRDAPHLFGLGLQEMLADEMTTDLRAARTNALAQAKAQNRPVNVDLRTKGVRFGRLRALPDGSVDTSQVQGVNADLRVRPFFANGGTVSMREFAIGAFKAEMGLEANDDILCDVTDPSNPQKRTSPAGFVFDPATDLYERPPVCDVSEDGDNDGVRNEIDMALVDHMEFYLLNYFKPGQGPGDARTRSGLALMNLAQCTTCHVQNLRIAKDRRVADVETVHDPVRGIFNRLFATASTRFTAQPPDSQPYPQLLPSGQSFVVANFFSDLKRHDLGPAFHEREYDGSTVTQFVTEPLWGVGTTAPYGHDGRSINLEEVILRHGGEAQTSRNVFAAMPADGRRRIVEYLQTLVLFPPDDTA
ncbi:MAG TPA: di-heme oxidoredictase family protein, partial [Myxococcota bacterium]|nr:di-heme oxidoredictase family protein [Myxococcota bacterium]